MSATAERVIVGMSGGVDSSVAAALLLERGYRVEGLFMKNWEEDDGTEYCTAKEDLADAQAVCERLGIRLNTANFAAEYWDNVFEYFLAEYRAYRTPNPDVLCNREIKFKVFADYAQWLGADWIATGHYARTSRANGGAQLLKGVDPGKDQSYFLHNVENAGLALTLFPLGELTKAEVRELADAYGFANAAKKDSTGICFIGERRFSDFLARYLATQPGAIETPEGELLGEHQGLMFYTIGQRQGLGIGGCAQRENRPWYVVDKDVRRNALIVAQGNDHPRLYSRGLSLSSIHWIAGEPPALPLDCYAKTRYRQPDQPCRVTPAAEGGYQVHFEQPQRAVTPGQYAVFYQGELCLGGGVIEARRS